MSEQFGASKAQWEHFSKTLGLTVDLLPVVSKPTAKISEHSTMKQLGKTPSRYNGSGEVVGFANWTQHQSTPSDIRIWSGKPDYGICIQSRTVRAFDLDCEDGDTINAIIDTITTTITSSQPLPERFRGNSSKCLLAFSLPGDLPKRVIRMKEGIIELLGTGQQFIACGTHPSGEKYDWVPQLPEFIPELTLEEVDAIWSALEAKFAVAPSTTSTKSSKVQTLHAAIVNDPVAQHLIDAGAVLSTDRDGKMHITCPFEDGHSTVSAISSTTYFPANTGGYQFGHFDCKHASCEHRTDQDFKDALEVPYDDPMNDFDVLPPLNTTENVVDIEGKKTTEAVKPRFTVVPAHEFAQSKPQPWIIKKVLPQAEVGVIYGESTAGKSFFVLDLAGSIARGVPWRGHHVNQGNVVYVAAEGAGGMRGRLSAYGAANGVDLASLPIGVIADAPNFMEVSEVKSVLQAIKTFGPVSVIIVDTFAQVMAGANENSGEDVGKALKHCKALHKHTGALVLLVHHAGKDTSKGARGWSGLRAAADVEIEVVRDGDDRVATITKMKDGNDDVSYGFKLNTVVVGVDEDMEEITSCVIEHTEAERKIKVNAKGSNERIVLHALAKVIGLGAPRAPYSELVTETVNHLLYDEKSGKRDRRRDVASQAIRALIDAGKLTEENGFISFPHSDEEELA